MENIKLENTIPKLDDNNYHLWRIKINLLFTSYDLSCWLENTPSSESTEKKNDSKALSLLYLCMSDKYILLFGNKKNTKELWDSIESRFNESNISNKISLLRELSTTKMDSKSSLTQHLVYLNQLFTLLESANEKQSELSEGEVKLVSNQQYNQRFNANPMGMDTLIHIANKSHNVNRPQQQNKPLQNPQQSTHAKELHDFMNPQQSHEIPNIYATAHPMHPGSYQGQQLPHNVKQKASQGSRGGKKSVFSNSNQQQQRQPQGPFQGPFQRPLQVPPQEQQQRQQQRQPLPQGKSPSSTSTIYGIFSISSNTPTSTVAPIQTATQPLTTQTTQSTQTTNTNAERKGDESKGESKGDESKGDERKLGKLIILVSNMSTSLNNISKKIDNLEIKIDATINKVSQLDTILKTTNDIYLSI